MPHFEIFSFSAADAAAMAELETVCFSSPWTAEMILSSFKNGDLFFVAKSGDTLCGYCGLQVVLDEGYLLNLAVAPAWRRKGIGKALLARLCKVATEQNLRFLTLEVRASNQAALALYAASGFSVAGRRTGFYTAPKEDAILMTKEFEHENSGH
jgi:ribosomal-protein-alanine N-acetyltransferase